MANYPDWYISKIEQFVNLGFFEKDGSKEEIAQRISRESEKSYFGNILHLQDNDYLEQIIVSYDHKKVWFIEDWLNYGAYQEDRYNFYEGVFTRLSAISEGVFNPAHIKTEACGYCDGRDKRLTVFFQLNENRCDVNFCADGTVLILKFLEEINELLTPEKCSFEYIFDTSGTGFIFFLTHRQKEYLTKERKWNFNENTGYWLDKAQFYRDTEDSGKAENYFNKAIQTGTNDISYFSFAISEFGCFLEEQNQHRSAVEIYEKGVKFLQSRGNLDEKQEWWLSSLEGNLTRLLNIGSS